MKPWKEIYDKYDARYGDLVTDYVIDDNLDMMRLVINNE